jgi:hypothetical protein
MDDLLFLLNRLCQANLLVTIKIDASQADQSIWALFDNIILAQLAKIGTTLPGRDNQHAFHSLNWRILKPGNRVQGKRKYDTLSIVASQFTAAYLAKHITKDVDPDTQNKILFVGK